MADESDEIYRDTDDARGGSTPNILRWMLAISLLAAILLLSAIWIFGAWSNESSQAAGQPQDSLLSEAAPGNTGGAPSDNAPDQPAR